MVRRLVASLGLLIAVVAVSCSSGVPSSTPASWPSQPSSGTAVIQVSGDLNAEFEWRVGGGRLPGTDAEGAGITWTAGSKSPGAFAIGATNPFVGEELTRDVEGDRVVLFLVVPGPDGGFFVAGDGQCLIDVSRATESAIDGQAT